MSNDIRSRYIGPCYSQDDNKQEPTTDLATFILRLLLFDTYILESNKLKEFENIISYFGYGGAKEILNSGAIRIHSEAYAIGQTGQTGLGFRGKKKDGSPKKLLPLNSYSFDIIMHSGKKKIMHDDLQKIHSIKGITQKEAIKLKGLIAGNLVWYPEESARYILRQHLDDLRKNTPNLKKAILSKAKEKLGVSNVHEDFSLFVDVDEDDDVHISSDLSKTLSLDEQTIHKIVESALLAVGALNKRIETMRAFSAVTGFRENELSIFEEKVEFILNTVAPEPQEEKLNNILSWQQFPDLNTAIKSKRLNIETLLKVRESQECKEFRNWLWSCDSLEVEELKARLTSLSARLSLKMTGMPSKALRWFTTTGIGLEPHIGLVAGPILGLLDTFLLDKFLPKSGVLTFLGRMYPSIFKGT